MKTLFALAMSLISASALAAQVCGKVAGDCDDMRGPTHQFLTPAGGESAHVFNLIETPAIEAQLCEWQKLGTVCLDGEFTDQVNFGFIVEAVQASPGN